VRCGHALTPLGHRSRFRLAGPARAEQELPPRRQTRRASAMRTDVSHFLRRERHASGLQVTLKDSESITDVALPETALSLRRSSQGWFLLAVTGNRESLERLDRFAPALVQRFAAASLGELKIVTELAARPPVFSEFTRGTQCKACSQVVLGSARSALVWVTPGPQRPWHAARTRRQGAVRDWCRAGGRVAGDVTTGEFNP
jgi:hypothetical protein